MNVIDVTPRPAAVSAAVRFLQSPFMSILGILFILTALKWGTLLFVVPQYETVITTRFGKIVRTITTPGLKIKLPVIDRLQRFDKRILAWDGPPIECPTKDKLYIIVDCFARWRISDPMLYYNRLNDERSALSRLDDILGSETRTAVATHDLVEIIRVTKGRFQRRISQLIPIRASRVPIRPSRSRAASNIGPAVVEISTMPSTRPVSEPWAASHHASASMPPKLCATTTRRGAFQALSPHRRWFTKSV